MVVVFLVLLCVLPHFSPASGEVLSNKRVTVSEPNIPCNENNHEETFFPPGREDVVWVCRSGTWTSYWADTTVDSRMTNPAMSCSQIKKESNATSSGMYWVNKTDLCMKKPPQIIQVYCEMTLDGGGWTMVWKHSYMEVETPLTKDMKYFSNFYKACEDVEAGWCNIPQKKAFHPKEMILVAYHNKSIVYAYKGHFNLNIDKDWYGGILYNPVKVVDMCEWGNGIVLAPYIAQGLGGLAFDKLSPTSYTENCDTYSGYLGDAHDCRFENCHTHSNQQMTMAMYVR